MFLAVFRRRLFVFLKMLVAFEWPRLHFHRVIPNFMIQFGCPNARDGRSLGRPEPKSRLVALYAANA